MKSNLFKKIWLLSAFLIGTAILSAGCGTGGDENISSESYSGSYATDDIDMGEQEIADPSGNNADAGQGIDGTPETKTDAASSGINTEMLVYTCDISIDTLDYEKSVADFKNMLKSVNGFIENESYSDGRSIDSYYIEDTDKEKKYTTTVRVPHDKYEDFLAGADNLGDVRSKTSNVDNVSREYSDLNTTLEIYEAKEARYIKRLSTIEDDAQAISVEKELTELQVQIAQIKTRLNEIKTDVDYSTINVTLREVTKYNEEPKKTDTFSERLSNTLSDTWRNFLIFLEGLLFLAIRVFPYLILIALIVLAIYFIQKKVYQKKGKNTKNRRQNPSPNMIQFTDNEMEEDDIDGERTEDSSIDGDTTDNTAADNDSSMDGE